MEAKSKNKIYYICTKQTLNNERNPTTSANRLKWDLYRRYCVDDYVNYDPSNPWEIEGNKTIGPERGQTLNVDEGYILRLNHFYDLRTTDPDKINTDLNDIVKENNK